MTNELRNVPDLRFPGFEGEWEESNIDNEFDFFNNKRKPIKENLRNKGEYPYYGATGIIDYVDDFIFDGNFILIGEDGANIISRSAPLVYFATGKFWVNNHAHILYPKFGDIYFNYLLLENIDYEKYNTGTAQPKLNVQNLKKIKIKSPRDNSEQQKIGKFFSKLDRQIELEEQKLEKLEEQKKGYMQKIFSQELRFKDENGNEYPEWEEKTIKDVYKVTRGYVLARKLMSDNPNSINKYPVYSSQTSNNGLMGYYSDYLYQDGITWTTDGANAGSVSFRQGKFYCTNVCGVLLNELGNSNVCMAEMLNNIAFKYVSKVGNPKLMNNVMAMIKLKFPCLEEQQAISKFLNVFSEVIDNQNKKVELLKERKKGLLQKMFV
ncbi:restriction endonuclease subunit S [Staphylococcus sp. GDH8C109P]|uniref:restriction endonuclease subunit S n=1 Tax=Staphylococcus sp. GDH8C109P TaxID=2804088 RepID=UPI001AEBC925|nr:restriction endonuclease subunit S [Staphylococcus sp. GDH8C109P]